MVRLRATSSKRASAVPKSAASRAPVLAAVHRSPVPPQETLKHSSLSVSVGSLGPGVCKFAWALRPWAWGISSQPLQCSPSYWGFSDLGCGVSPHGCSSNVFRSSWPWTWGIFSQLLQCLQSYWGFSDLGRGVSPHGHSWLWMWGISSQMLQHHAAATHSKKSVRKKKVGKSIRPFRYGLNQIPYDYKEARIKF